MLIYIIGAAIIAAIIYFRRLIALAAAYGVVGAAVLFYSLPVIFLGWLIGCIVSTII